jgi:hypothetical protein
MSVGWCNLIAPQDNHRSRRLSVHRCSRGRCVPPNWNLRLPCRQCRHSKSPWPVTTALADDDSPTRVSSVRAPCPVPTPVSIAALTRRWYPRQTGPRWCSHEGACWPLMADPLSPPPLPSGGLSWLRPADTRVFQDARSTRYAPAPQWHHRAKRWSSVSALPASCRPATRPAAHPDR